MSFLPKLGKYARKVIRKNITNLEIAKLIGDPFMPTTPILSCFSDLKEVANTLHKTKGKHVWTYALYEENTFLTKRFLERQ